MIQILSLLGILLAGSVDAQEACNASTAKKNIEKILASYASNGLPLEDPSDRFSCVFEKQSAKVGVNFASAFKIFDPEDKVPSKLEQTCLGEFNNNEAISQAELYFRRAKCHAESQYLNNKGIDGFTKEKILTEIKEASKEFITLNRDYFKNPETIEMMKEVVINRANQRKRELKCANGVAINVALNPKGIWEDLVNANEVGTGEDAEGLNQAANEIFKKKREVFLSGRFKKMQENAAFFCGGVKKTAEPRRGVASERVVSEFVVDLEDLKQPNEWKVGPESAAKMMKQIESHPDFEKNRQCFKNIESIEIQSASSKLRNNPARMEQIYQKYPETRSAVPARWDFHALSYARAREIEENLVNSLVKKHGLTLDNKFSGSQKKLVTAVLGDDGSGGAGFCPYRLVEHNGKYRVEPLSNLDQSPKLKQELKEKQAAKVVIRFTDNCRVDKKVLNNQPLGHMMFTDPCLHFEYKCQ